MVAYKTHKIILHSIQHIQDPSGNAEFYFGAILHRKMRTEFGTETYNVSESCKGHPREQQLRNGELF